MGWLTRPRNDTFVSDDGSHACHRQKEGGIAVIKFKVKVMLAMRGMTQKELAERTGIRPPTVSAICVGSVKHLPVDALEKICDVLDCQPGDLMEYVREGVQ